MQSKQERIYNTARRIQTFLDANDAALGTINKSGMRSELDAVVAALGINSGQQAAGRVNALGETARQRRLRLALRLNHMRPIASVAKARLRDVPNFKSLTLPPAGIRVAGFIAHAQAMAEAAEPYEQVFTDAGLAADFRASLVAAADAVKASIDTRATAHGQRASATGSLAQLARRARLVFNALNDFVVPILSDDLAQGGLLAEWRSVRRVYAKGGPVVGSERAAELLPRGPQTAPPTAA